MQSSETNKIKLCVIGWPIEQSLSPDLHNHWLKALGIKGRYKKLACEPKNLEAFIAELKDKKYLGWNVTVPHKTAIVSMLDSIDEKAKKLGAVNTVKNVDGTLCGYNTDGEGFIRHLNNTAPNWRQDKPVLVLGAGGAARAIIIALRDAGVSKIYLCNRTKEKSLALKRDLDVSSVVVEDWDEKNGIIFEAGLVVNATTLGMDGCPPLDISLNHADSDTVIYDIVYKPLNTPLINSAKDRGLQTVDGLGMLFHQAVAAFEIWFDQKPDTDDGLLDALREQVS